MKTLRRFIPLAISALCAASLVNAAADDAAFALHSGDTVVFYGDSITDQRLYTMITELYAVTRYPDLNVTFVHSGWGGDRVTGGGGGPIDLRLTRDVFAYKPTVVTIMLGMNDGRYTDHTAADDEVYTKGYEHIIESLRHTLPGVRITAIEPSPYDDVTRPFTLQPDGYNSVMVKYSDWIKNYAGKNNLTLADFNGPMVEMLRKANATDPAHAQKILPDRVHPAIGGHLVMAEQLIKAWHGRAVVSAVTIDAAKASPGETQFARVSNVQSSGDTLTWTELEESLPLPFAQMIADDWQHTLPLPIASSDVTEALNQETLRVTGLKAGKYKLLIDGQNVGNWSDSEFKQGVNLAVLKTPMSDQADQVRRLTIRHIDVHQDRWRTIQVPLENATPPAVPEALRALDAVDQQVIAQQRAAAQPRPHVYQLIPAA